MRGTMAKPANFNKWDTHDALSVGQAANLWEGFEPLPNHEIYDDAYARMTLLKQELFKLLQGGHRKYPKRSSIWHKIWYGTIAEKLGERPRFLYPDAQAPYAINNDAGESNIVLSAHMRRDADAYEKTEAALTVLSGTNSRKAAYAHVVEYKKDVDGKPWTMGGLKAADTRHRNRIRGSKVQES